MKQRSKTVRKQKPIRLGVFGAGRGGYLGSVAKNVGMELVALCDTFEPLLNRTKKWINDDRIACYSDYDKFLEHDMDAVIVANYATEHTPAAVKALKAGKHVMSECMAMLTMAEGVQLAEAVEASGKVYMFAENYPFSATNQEMARLYKSGEMGEFKYGEAEYIHPVDPRTKASLTAGLHHWRAWIPVTYYSTHSMGPVMLITGTRPVQVNGFVIPYDYKDPIMTGQIRKSDTASVLMCKMNNDAYAKIMPCAFLRDHGTRVRICCNKGTMETNQGEGMLRVHREPFDFNPPKPGLEFYTPNFPPATRDAARYGHGGGDFFTSYYFAKAIREKSKPIIDVYMAIDMTAIGILGYRSALQGGIPLEVPDFRSKAVRAKYRKDDWNPDPARRRKGMPYSSVLGDVRVSEKTIRDHKQYRKEYEGNL